MKVSDWLSWNLPDPEVASVRPSNQHDAIGEVPFTCRDLFGYALIMPLIKVT